MSAILSPELRALDRIEEIPIRNFRPYPHPVRFTFGDHHPDALRAYAVQQDRATRHGQVWSDRHASAIRELHQAYTLTALGVSFGRTAWPLAVGTGKTESIVAFVVAQYERSLAGRPPLTLLVCMER